MKSSKLILVFLLMAIETVLFLYLFGFIGSEQAQTGIEKMTLAVILVGVSTIIMFQILGFKSGSQPQNQSQSQDNSGPKFD